MQSHNKAIFSIAFLILIAFTAYSYYDLTSNRNRREQLILHNSDLRLRMLKDAEFYIGTEFPVTHFQDIVNGDPCTSSFADITVLILLSSSGCNPCQQRELKNLDTLYREVGTQINFVSLFNSDDRKEGLLLRKVSRIDFPMWIGNDSTVAKYVGDRKYPLVFLLKDQEVISAFEPIPMDDGFSYSFFHSLKRKMTRR